MVKALSFKQVLVKQKEFKKKINSNAVRKKLYKNIKNGKIKIGDCTENFGASSKKKFQVLLNRKERIIQTSKGKYYRQRYGEPQLTKSSEVASLCIDGGCKKKAIVKISPVFIYKNLTPDLKSNYKEAREYNPSIVEAKILKLLTEKVVFKNYTPNIAMYYTSFRCEDSTELFKNNVGFRYLLRNNIIGPDLDVIIAEFVEGHDFYAFLKNNRNDPDNVPKLKSLLFQVIITLAILQDLFEFVHYDLHGGNVLVDTTKTPGGYWEYRAFGKKYYVPNWGVQSKLWDFDFSTTFKKEIIQNSKVFSGTFKSSGVKNKFNPYWDLFFFLSATNISRTYGKYMPDEIIKFYYDITPSELAQTQVPGRVKDGRIINPEPSLLTPRELLDHPFFAEYQVKQKDVIKPIYKYKP